MSLAPTLQQYLTNQQIAYDVIPHQETLSSTRTAEACHVSGDCLAKGVLLRDQRGYLLAVLPASHRIRLSDLQDALSPGVELAQESEVEAWFRDCERGAIPPVGDMCSVGSCRIRHDRARFHQLHDLGLARLAAL